MDEETYTISDEDEDEDEKPEPKEEVKVKVEKTSQVSIRNSQGIMVTTIFKLLWPFLNEFLSF